MAKTSVNFQMNLHRTVGRVAHTRYLYLILYGVKKDGKAGDKNNTNDLSSLNAASTIIYSLSLRQHSLF